VAADRVDGLVLATETVSGASIEQLVTCGIPLGVGSVQETTDARTGRRPDRTA